MVTRYPNYDVMSQYEHWDDTTRTVIKKRLDVPQKLRYLAKDEAEVLTHICSRLLFEEDKEILGLVVAHFDTKLEENLGDGYRPEHVPEDRVLLREGLKGLEELAQSVYKRSFPRLGGGEQDDILTQISKGSPPGGVWQRIPAKEFFQKLLLEALSAYYSHPQLWSEIGYGGPAYPRGYVRVEWGGVDPWEAVGDEK